MSVAKTPLEEYKQIIRMEYKLNELRTLMEDEKKNAKEISRCEKEMAVLQGEIDAYNAALKKKK